MFSKYCKQVQIFMFIKIITSYVVMNIFTTIR